MAKKVNNQPTEMDLALTRSEAFVEKHKKGLIIGLIALAVIVAAGFGVSKWLTNREDKAQTQLSMGINLMQQGEGAMQQAMMNDTVNDMQKVAEDFFKKALNGDGQYQGLLKIASSYSFTDAANLAKAYAGECYAKLGQTKEAIQMLESFSFKSDMVASPALKATLANCYATDNQLDKAVACFKEAADMADNAQISPAFLIEAANLLMAQKQNEEALKIYEQIKSDYPSSPMCTTQVSPQDENVVVQAEIEKYIEAAKK